MLHKEHSTFLVTFIESISEYGRAGESHYIQKATVLIVCAVTGQSDWT
jgi:hypothetical protein